MPPKTRSNDETPAFITKDELKELMNVQRETILACLRESLTTFVSTVNERVDRLSNDVQAIKTSLDFSGDVTENKIKEVSEHLEKIKIELKTTQRTQGDIFNTTSATKKKIIDLEDRSRRCNLRIDGVKESTNENWKETKSKVKLLLKENLEINEIIEIDRAHRIALSDFKRDNNKPRTIVCKLLRYADKEKVLSKTKLLHGTHIYINEDYSDETSQIRRELQLQAKKHRRRKIRAGCVQSPHCPCP